MSMSSVPWTSAVFCQSSIPLDNESDRNREGVSWSPKFGTNGPNPGRLAADKILRCCAPSQRRLDKLYENLFDRQDRRLRRISQTRKRDRLRNEPASCIFKRMTKRRSSCDHARAAATSPRAIILKREHTHDITSYEPLPIY